MADFEKATAVTGEDGRYGGEVDGDWCVWSPQGGYLMAMALRGAARATAFPRPLSLACHFLAVPKLGPIEIEVRSLRRARVAESLAVSLRQDDKAMLELMIWCGETVPGYEHVDASPPDVPHFDTLSSLETSAGKPGFQSLWKNLEHRPCGPLHFQRKAAAEPRQRDWVRFRSFEPGRDAYLDAGRCALLLDAFTWPAAAHAYAGDGTYIAPTLSFSIDFHEPTEEDWLLSDAYSPRAGRGLIAVHNRVFSPGGALLASGNGTLTCRPRPGR